MTAPVAGRVVNVLITPERLDSILRCGLDLYRKRDQRVSARGALADAAALCDALAAEFLMQNKRRRVPSKAAMEIAAAFQRAGDEIMRMRDRVRVPA